MIETSVNATVHLSLLIASCNALLVSVCPPKIPITGEALTPETRSPRIRFLVCVISMFLLLSREYYADLYVHPVKEIANKAIRGSFFILISL